MHMMKTSTHALDTIYHFSLQQVIIVLFIIHFIPVGSSV